ncbi:MAG TPA: ribonuclease III [bacterium]|nr:ribonuclease III [bacterium]
MALNTLLRMLFPSQKPTELVPLYTKLGYVFHDETYVKKALTHASLDNNRTNHLRSYERLEFLGDAVLELIISEFLFTTYPSDSEGELTEKRAQLVNKSALAAIGQNLGLPRFIRSQTVVENPIEHSESVLSDVVEAIIGAIYLDGGMKVTEKVVYDLFPLTPLKDKNGVSREINYKGELIEFCHEHHLPPPEFTTLQKSGPDHSRIYTIGVSLQGKTYGIGEGSSKKKAGQIAARKTLHVLEEKMGLD